jgi:hypothetical protein
LTLIILYNFKLGRVDEWFKSHAWKACSEYML